MLIYSSQMAQSNYSKIIQAYNRWLLLWSTFKIFQLIYFLDWKKQKQSMKEFRVCVMFIQNVTHKSCELEISI